MSDNCDICVKFFTYNMDVPFFEHGLALIIFYQYVIVLWEGSMHATINSSWPEETSASSIRNLNSSRTHVRLGAWFWSAKADIFFSESLHIYTPFRSAQNHCLPDNVRPRGAFISVGDWTPTEKYLLLLTTCRSGNLLDWNKGVYKTWEVLKHK